MVQLAQTLAETDGDGRKQHLQQLDAVKEHLEQKQVNEARSILQSCLEYRKQGSVPIDLLPRVYDLLRQTGELSDASYTEKATRAASEPENVQILVELGHHLDSMGAPLMAVTLFKRAHDIAPGDIDVLAKFAMGLNTIELHEEALEALLGFQHMLEDDYDLRQYLAWTAVKCGKVDLARSWADSVHPDWQPVPIHAALERIGKIEAVTSLSDRDIRGWHMALNGSILLHLSPHGFNEGMYGRYAFVKDAESLCLEGIRRIQLILQDAEIIIPRVFFLPENSKSFVLGMALAQELGCEGVPWPTGGTSKPGILAIYGMEDVRHSTVSQLWTRQKGQYIWAHGLSWTAIPQQFPAPEFITLLYQTRISAWDNWSIGQKMEARVDEADTVDKAALELLVKRLCNVEVEEISTADMNELLALTRASDVLSGSGTRDLFSSSCIVKSNAFRP